MTAPDIPAWKIIKSFIRSEDIEALGEYIGSLPRPDLAQAIPRLGPEEQARLFSLLPPEEIAEAVSSIPELAAVQVVDEADRLVGVVRRGLLRDHASRQSSHRKRNSCSVLHKIRVT